MIDRILVADIHRINIAYFEYIYPNKLIVQYPSGKPGYDVAVSTVVELNYSPDMSEEKINRLFAAAAYLLNNNNPQDISDIFRAVMPKRIPSDAEWLVKSENNYYTVVPAWLLPTIHPFYPSLFYSPAVWGRYYVPKQGLEYELRKAFSISGHKVDLCLSDRGYAIYIYPPIFDNTYGEYIKRITTRELAVQYIRNGNIDTAYCIGQLLYYDTADMHMKVKYIYYQDGREMEATVT